ncbi:ABC transporter permease [Rhodococcus sp. HNM0569]|uniref:ABC transporter permease n=1 Tax=Rhodococcus sp. HNM0569 TaxID=2716340 RepID=UPI00146C25BB|nr:ABC transporter permease [Rhodococcus sp. HNM0569]NLU85093.1 ABC transporter permease [Rhodococcus sp. HNM0569]
MAVRRCAFAVPLLAIVSAGLFALASRSPFDPLAGYLGARYVTTSDADRARIAGELGLGDPWWRQYARWLLHVVTGDLGTSRSFGQPVAQVIGERLPWTLLLTGTALTVSVVLALVLGVWTGARSGGVADRIVTPLVTFAQATPPFVLSLVAVAVFAVSLTWLPAGGLTDAGSDPSFGQVARHVVLPAGVLAVSQLPWLLFAVRQSVRGAVESDAVAGAVARGLPRRTVLTRHVVPVASAPFVTVVALRLPELVVGAALVEEVFAWPGIAGALVTSATELDFPLLAALTLGTTAVVLVASLLADIAYVLLDPRVAADA